MQKKKNHKTWHGIWQIITAQCLQSFIIIFVFVITVIILIFIVFAAFSQTSIIFIHFQLLFVPDQYPGIPYQFHPGRWSRLDSSWRSYGSLEGAWVWDELGWRNLEIYQEYAERWNHCLCQSVRPVGFRIKPTERRWVIQSWLKTSVSRRKV